MIIIDSLNQLNMTRETTVTIGKFDGIHRGHRELVERIVREAEKQNLCSVVFTIEFPDSLRIYTDEETERILSDLGVDYWVRIPFTEELRDESREDFLQDVLLDRLKMKVIVSGYDFTFGKGALGNADYLKEVEETFGFHYLHEDTEFDGEGAVSSTRIRKDLAEGKVEAASFRLGRYYYVEGEIIHGAHIGSSIGFPTVNVVPGKGKLLPLFGVYSVLCEVDGKRYGGVANLGLKPTVHNVTEPLLEAHLFDCNEDLYGKFCRISLVSFIREERKLNSLEGLKSQIALDVVSAKRTLARLNLDKE